MRAQCRDLLLRDAAVERALDAGVVDVWRWVVREDGREGGNVLEVKMRVGSSAGEGVMRLFRVLSEFPIFR